VSEFWGDPVFGQTSKATQFPAGWLKKRVGLTLAAAVPTAPATPRETISKDVGEGALLHPYKPDTELLVVELGVPARSTKP
jgi:hypothetical protein